MQLSSWKSLTQVFIVRVVPLVKRSDPFICETKTALTQKHLDASQLAGLTNSNPIYFLLEPPKHGKIMRIVRPSGSRSKVLVSLLAQCIANRITSTGKRVIYHFRAGCQKLTRLPFNMVTSLSLVQFRCNPKKWKRHNRQYNFLS